MCVCVCVCVCVWVVNGVCVYSMCGVPRPVIARVYIHTIHAFMPTHTHTLEHRVHTHPHNSPQHTNKHTHTATHTHRHNKHTHARKTYTKAHPDASTHLWVSEVHAQRCPVNVGVVHLLQERVTAVAIVAAPTASGLLPACARPQRGAQKCSSFKQEVLRVCVCVYVCVCVCVRERENE